MNFQNSNIENILNAKILNQKYDVNNCRIISLYSVNGNLNNN